MSDLQKFIRQQFFDNHWTRDVDLTTLTEDKLSSLNASFNHIDVKSKLCLLLAFSNAKPNLPPEINKHVESIFLQALDEENNLVKAVATILHTKQALGYLNFDISPTNEAFKKNLERLLKVSDRWCVVQTPLLAEYLGENVLNAVVNGVSPKRDQTAVKRPHPSSTYRKRTTRVLGFRPRGKPESVTVKETYLEKLKDECQRRRVHVPIPGRSFTRQDEADESNHADGGGGFMGSSSTLPRRDPHPPPNRKGPVAHNWNRPPDLPLRKPPAASTPHPSSWSRTSTDLSERTSENRPIPLTERLAARTSAAANCRKPSGIKLLDFDQLPAFGPKAKQLRKEQMEKEREMKKLEKEERLKEQRAAREAAKLARQSERQAQMEARRHNASTAWNAVPPPSTAADSLISDLEVNGAHTTTTNTTNLDTDAHDLPENTTMIDSRLSSGDGVPLPTASHKPFSLPPSLPNAGNFMVRHPLLSTPISLPSTTMAPGATTVVVGSGGAGVDEDDDDDEDEDDDDDDMMLRDPGTGLYKLGISSDFRGFNPSARITIHGNVVASSSSVSSGLTYSSTTSSASNFVPQNLYTLQSNPQLAGLPGATSISRPNLLSNLPAQQQQTQQQLTPQQPVQHQTAPVLITSNTNVASPHRLIAPRPIGVPTIKVVGGSHSNPMIRLIQPTSAPNTKLAASSGPPVASAQSSSSTLHALVSAPNTLCSPPTSRSGSNTSGATSAANMSTGGSANPPASTVDADHAVGQTPPQLLSPDTHPPNLSPPFSTGAPVLRPQQLPVSPTPIRIAPRPPGVRVVRVTNPTALSELRPRIPSNQSQPQQQQQPQQPHMVNISAAPRVAYIAQSTTQAQLRPAQPQQQQPQPQAQTVLVSKNPPGAVQSTTPLSPTHTPSTRPVNSAWMSFDGRSVILTPVIAVPGSQSPPKIGLLSPPSQTVQACQNSGYIQFVQHPASRTTVASCPQTLHVVQQQQQQQQPQQQQQLPGPPEMKMTSPVGETGFMDQSPTQQQQQQQQQPVHTYAAGTGGMMDNTGSAKFIPAQQTLSSAHPGAQLINPNESSSAVKIQDDLCLTEAQVNSVQNLFQGANRVSRPEKAMIVSFIAGARGNPHPEAGNTLRIRLSEYRERVLNQATGQLMDVAADTYLHMDYATGKCEKVKYYRNEPPEVLLRLPVQPAALH